MADWLLQGPISWELLSYNLEEGEGVQTLDPEVGPAFETGCAPLRTTFRWCHWLSRRD